MRHAYFMTGKCCSGKDHYINNVFVKQGMVLRRLDIGNAIKQKLGEEEFNKIVKNSTRPSSPHEMDKIALDIINEVLDLDQSKFVIINGYPRHVDQYKEIMKLRLLYAETRMFIVVINTPQDVRLNRAKNDELRTQRINNGEMEITDMISYHMDLDPNQRLSLLQLEPEATDVKNTNHKRGTAPDR